MSLVFLLLMAAVSGAEKSKTANMSVTEGDAVTLQSGLSEILNDDTILWMFGRKDTLISQIRRKDDLTSFLVTDDVGFRGRLQVDQNTGSLTIRNTRIRHSGQYKLSISREKTTIKIFNVTIFVKSLSATAGGSVSLQTNAEIQSDDLILWTLGAENILVVKKDSGTTTVNERFRGRLRLGKTTASLTITNITNTDSGHFKLQIINTEKTTFRRFSVTVSGSTGNQVSELETAVMLLSDDLDGVTEQEETWSL